MARNPSVIPCEGSEATWRELDLQLDELLQLAQTTSSASEFHAAVLARIMAAVSANIALFWVPAPTGSLPPSMHSVPAGAASASWELASVCGIPRDELHSRVGIELRDHTTTLQRRLADAGISAARFDSAPTMRVGSCWSALAPVCLDGRVVAALEVLWATSVPVGIPRNVCNVLIAFAESTAEFSRRQELRALRLQLDKTLASDDFALELQCRTDERGIAFAAANELGRFVDCDRVTVLTRDRRWQVFAVSHNDTFDRRSPLIREAERLATVAAQDAQPVWLGSTSQLHSLPAGTAWQEYFEESSARSAALLPLVESGATRDDEHFRDVIGDVIGALLIERFAEQSFSREEQRRVELLARHVSAALSRVRSMRHRTLLGFLRRKSSVLGILFGIGLAIASLVPVEFEITARGELQPEVRRDLFAPSDALVRTLHVRSGQQVEAGAPLLELTNDDLDFELTRLSGELQTVRQQLGTVQAARLDASVPTSARDQLGQLAAEEERLKQVFRGLEQQHRQRLQRRDELTIRSPIAGRVVTSNLDQTLRSRPLRRGQQLLTVADEHGPWVLDLRVADQDIGHLLAARQAGLPAPLRFTLATQPAVTHRATVYQVADWSEVDQSGDARVRVTARIDDPERFAAGLAVRPGATVNARVHCGKARLGYVWLRDAIEHMRTWLM